MAKILGGKKLTGNHPLAYMGVEPSSPPNFLRVTRAPTTSDTGHNVGTLWIHEKSDASLINDIYMLVDVNTTLTPSDDPAGPAQWVLIGVGSGEIATLTGDSGGAVYPDSSNNIDVNGGDLITITGTPASNLLTVDLDNGTDGQIIIASTAGSPAYANLTSTGGTITISEGSNSINLDVDTSVANSFPTDGGTAVPAAGALTVAGGSLITTSGAASTVTVGLNNGTDGQVIIGSTAGSPAYANITSTGGTITVSNGSNTINLEVAASGTTFAADSGSATPAAGTLTIAGNHGINTTGAAATITVQIDNAIALGDLSVVTTGNDSLMLTSGDLTIAGTGASAGGNLNLPATGGTSAGDIGVINVGGTRYMHNYGTNNEFLGLGAGNFTLTGNNNIGIGANSLDALTTGATNVAVGIGALSAIDTENTNTAVGYNAGLVVNGSSGLQGHENTLVGHGAGNTITSGRGNTAFGMHAMGGPTTGSVNTAIGSYSLTNITSGNYNVAIGNPTSTSANPQVTGAGYAYASSESSNIVIQNSGVVGESNVIRIGAHGSGAGQQNKCFMAGIRGVTTGVADAVAVLIDSAYQLGTVSSSIRVKKNIEDMGNATGDLLNLRPVMFDYIDSPSDRRQYGLIAEEVEKIMPDLVVYDKEQKPETVRYHELPVMLLNEMKKMQARIEALEKRLESL